MHAAERRRALAARWCTFAAAATVAMTALSGCGTVRGFQLALGAFFGRSEPDLEALDAELNRSRPTSPAKLETRAGDWQGYRGAARDGVVSQATRLAVPWSGDRPTELWRRPIGGGYSSFAVVGDVVFTHEQRRDLEVVVAYDVVDGDEIWSHEYPARFEEAFSGAGPRATPTYAEGRLYALGATGTLLCIDASDGDLLWSRDVLDETGSENLMYGVSASPLIVGPLVVAGSGAPIEEQSTGGLAAFDRESGELVWTALPEGSSYVSPMLATIADTDQVLAASKTRVVGVDPSTGEILWEVPWKVVSGIHCAQPLVLDGDRVMISASYGAGAKMFVVEREGGAWSTRTIWENGSLRSKFNGNVVRDGHIWGLDEGILVCVDATTGKRRWKGGRYGYGHVTLLERSDGPVLLVLGGKGDLAVVRASTQRHEELRRFRVFDGNTWTSPVFAGSRLVIRNSGSMACFELAAADVAN